jgi:hypothetical protein
MLDRMIGALILSAFALAAGASDPLWVSSSTPVPGTIYRAMTWSGEGGLDCTGVITGGPAFAGWVRYEGRTGVCLLSIPSTAAGKQLRVMYGVTTWDVDHETVTHGSLPPRLVGAAPVPRAGKPFSVVLSPSEGDLKCEGGTINGKRIPIRYERGEGTVACFLLIPKAAAGKWLLWSCTNFFTTPPVLHGHDADGNPFYAVQSGVADCLVRRDRIRR